MDNALHVLEVRLQQQKGRETWVLAEHVHFEPGKDPEGHELRPFRDRPRIGVDAVFRDSADGDKIVALHQHHGNRFHGFPPHHPEHETFVCGHTWGPVAYNHTMERTADYRCKLLHDGATAISDDIIIETWGYDLYKRTVKTDPAAQLKYIEYTRRPCGRRSARRDAGRRERRADGLGQAGTPRAEREDLKLPPGCALPRRVSARAAASTATSATTSAATAA